MYCFKLMIGQGDSGSYRNGGGKPDLVQAHSALVASLSLQTLFIFELMIWLLGCLSVECTFFDN